MTPTLYLENSLTLYAHMLKFFTYQVFIYFRIDIKMKKWNLEKLCIHRIADKDDDQLSQVQIKYKQN